MTYISNWWRKTMSEKTTLIEFPCDFSIKIIGNNNILFIEQILLITAKHFPEHDEQTVEKNLSKNKNYLSLTVTVHVLNQTMLDNFYREISSHPEVKMVL